MPQYTFEVVTSVYTEESISAGEAESNYIEPIQPFIYDLLQELLEQHAVTNHSWLSWSSQPRSNKYDWVTSDIEEDYTTGESLCYSLFIRRTDGLDLSPTEVSTIEETLGLI